MTETLTPIAGSYHLARLPVNEFDSIKVEHHLIGLYKALPRFFVTLDCLRRYELCVTQIQSKHPLWPENINVHTVLSTGFILLFYQYQYKRSFSPLLTLASQGTAMLGHFSPV